MRKAMLRRERHRNLVGGNEDRLAELPIPGPVLLLDALEGGELKQFPEASKWKSAKQEVTVRADTDVVVQMEPFNSN